ncbi:MAG: M3 family oligoendopeptidase [Bacteroidota bacterium]|nr:M3 family oligoendopeptidase [Bacteroidota bacterium]
MIDSLPTGAEQVRWDLSDLYPDPDALEEDIQTAHQSARTFAEQYHDRVRQLNVTEMRTALEHLEDVHERAGRAATYAYLSWATATDDAARGALLQHVREASAAINQQVLFFELEWRKVPSDRAAMLLARTELDRYRHHLTRERLFEPYSLSEPEEKILQETAVTGRNAWKRFFSESVGAIRYDYEDTSVTQQEILAKLYESDRSVRRKAALSFTDGLQAAARPLTYIFNTLLADKASRDRLRHLPSWIAGRHLANEITDAMAQALIDAVTSRYDLVARYYRLKRKVLQLEELHDYDRYAPVAESATFYSWSDARDLTLSSYQSFHPRMGQIAERFFAENWIDAAVVEGKQAGAFSHGAVPSVHPYVLLNYTGRARDVQTLAHELGHGIHQYLASEQGLFEAGTPLTTAETASVFGEMLVFQQLLSAESGADGQLALLMGKIDDTMATVFRQIAMNRFEDAIHTARRNSGELSMEQFGDLWMATQSEMFQGSVTLGEHYRHWWSYIPHFLHTPGYVYAYAFGELLVLALHGRYQSAPEDFPHRYLQLLAAGGSDWPHVLVGSLGADLKSPSFWQQGLTAIEAMIGQAESLYAAA